MSLFNQNTVSFFLPQRSIATFSAYIALEEVASDELEITKHPVQSGAVISDHAYKKPSKVSIKAVFSPDTEPLAETYEKLLKLQSDRIPFDVITGKRTYTNMLCATLMQTNDSQTERILSVSFDLQEVTIVDVTTTTVPERSKQADAGKTGATEQAGSKSAETESAAGETTSRGRSALAALLG